MVLESHMFLKEKRDGKTKGSPTGDMIADFATKSFHGAIFEKFRDMIMGVVPAQDPGTGKLKTTSMDAKSVSRPSKDKKGLVTPQ
jgi:hypothetical protein